MLHSKSETIHISTNPRLGQNPLLDLLQMQKVGGSRNSTWKDKSPSFFPASTYCVTLSQHICLSDLNLSPLKEEFVYFCKLCIEEQITLGTAFSR